ncbi:hypothetical protein RN001_002421 [Aquatica leii]|uniref:Uncharacterized protein n=1 Tax=Aquatica leii TaxID=1421715 RepID=A0AAN7PDE4_9COLE|nr:hypothetical protein RN001_002421 [Aquatica leii]
MNVIIQESLRFQVIVCNKLPITTKDIEDLKEPKKIKHCDTKKLQAIALYSSFRRKNKLSFCSTIKIYEVILVERRFQ